MTALLAFPTTLVGVVSPEELTAACGDDPGWGCEHVYDWTGSRWWANLVEWLLAKPITILAIVLVAAIVARVVRWIISRMMRRLMTSAQGGNPSRIGRHTSSVLLSVGDDSLRNTARAETLTAVFRSLATAFVWFVAMVGVFEVLGVSLGPILATAGILGVALGFGTQQMVRDFIAGFFIVTEDQLGVGDTVDLGGGAKGVVERVSLRATHLRDVEGTVWHVPNGQITRVANRSQEWARALIDVVVPYSVDIATVSEVMRSTAEALAADPDYTRSITDAPEVWGIQEFSPAGVEVRLVIRTLPAAQFAVLRELRARLKIAFAEAGITFAYAGGPTQVVLIDERAAGSGPVGIGGQGDQDNAVVGDVDGD
ncbi:MAG: mechanosensitive ion channel family protein [Actinobacteria bacterium]|nr:mechanosensitive ion channel family protein [Actinomycetota bacterium]